MYSTSCFDNSVFLITKKTRFKFNVLGFLRVPHCHRVTWGQPALDPCSLFLHLPVPSGTTSCLTVEDNPACTFNQFKLCLTAGPWQPHRPRNAQQSVLRTNSGQRPTWALESGLRSSWSLGIQKYMVLKKSMGFGWVYHLGLSDSMPYKSHGNQSGTPLNLGTKTSAHLALV